MLDGILGFLKHPALRREDGTATVEAVLWLPIFIMIFGLMVDTTMIFNGQAKVLRVIQDSNRNMSIGRFTTEIEVEDYIDAQLALLNISADTVEAVADANFVQTTVTVPADQFQLLGDFTSLLNLEVTVTAVHLLETWDPDTYTPSSPPAYGT